MSVQIKLKRGTTAQHSTFTGAQGEVSYDTTKKTLVPHDGSTAGGNPLATEAGLAAGVAEAKTYTDDSLDPILDEMSDGGPTLALLETITIPAGGATEVLRTQLPNATAYNLSVVLVKISAPIGTESIDGVIRFKPKDTANYITAYLPAFVNTAARYSYARCYKQFGYWFSDNVVAITSSNAIQGSLRGPYFSDICAISASTYKTVDSVRLLSLNSKVIPEGTVIEIWGAQAT
jgi:hypothetical protein